MRAASPKAQKTPAKAVQKSAPKGVTKPTAMAAAKGNPKGTMAKLLAKAKSAMSPAQGKKTAPASKTAPAAKASPAARQAPAKHAAATAPKGKAAAAKSAPGAVKGKAVTQATAKATQVALKSKDLDAIRAARATAFSQIPSARATAEAGAEAVCREVACENLATTGGYCRLHYIKNWKKIKRKEIILKEGKLNQYIEELVAKYPDKYIEAIRQDLENDKDFAKVIYDLDLDEDAEDFENEGENLEGLVDNVGSKRDFEDEGDAF